MSIKERISQKVQKIVEEKDSINEKIINFLKEDYRKTLEDYENSHNSIKQATHDALEGIEEGLKSAEHKGEDILSNASTAIVEVAHEVAKKTLEEAQKVTDEAREIFDEAVEKTSEGVDEVKESAKQEMKKAIITLQEKTAQEKSKLNEVSEGIKEFIERDRTELSDKAKDALKYDMQQIKYHILLIIDKSEIHSKKILKHSRAAVSNWLQEIKDKLD